MENISGFYRQYTNDPPYKRSKKEERDLFEGLIPVEILVLWEKDGWCSYNDGFLWTFNPSDFSETLNKHIDSDNGIVPLMRSAFEDFIFFDLETSFFEFLKTDNNCIHPMNTDVSMFFNVSLRLTGFREISLKKKLFLKLKSSLGRLGPNQCYSKKKGSKEYEITDLTNHLKNNVIPKGLPDYPDENLY